MKIKRNIGKLVATILQRIREKLSNRRKRKQMEQTYRVEIEIGEYIDSLIQRTKSSIDESVNLKPLPLRRAFRCLKCLLNFTQAHLRTHVEEDKLEEALTSIMLPHARILDSLKLLEDSILLAMSGRYTSAFATLRTGLECIVVGGFYHGLTSSNMRNQASRFLRWRMSIYPRGKRFDDIVEHVILENQSASENGLLLEGAIEQELERHNPPLPPPNFRRMLGAVVEWFTIDTFENPVQHVADYLYERLSMFTHAMQDSTTYKQLVLSHETEFTIDSGKILELMLDEYIRYFFEVVDAIGSIYFSVISSTLGSPPTRPGMTRIIGDCYFDGHHLDHTIDTVFAAVGLRSLSENDSTGLSRILTNYLLGISIPGLSDQSFELRYQRDEVQLDFHLGTVMFFADVRLWERCFWDEFHVGFQFMQASKGKYRIVGISRGTRFESLSYSREFFSNHMDKVLFQVIFGLVDRRGEEYQDTLQKIADAIRHGYPLFVYGQPTWKLDPDKVREQGGC